MAETESSDTTPNPAMAKLRSLTDLEEKIVTNLSSEKRSNLSAPYMIWIVKTASNLGTDDANKAAADLIRRIFEKAASEKDFKDALVRAKAEASLHSLGASLQAKLGRYDGAWDDIKALIAQYPRALDPRISEAKILTEWAAKDSSKYKEAINAWNRLREKLERMSGAAGPNKLDPKYEVILNEAECFYRMAMKNKNKDEGKQYAKTGLELLMPYLNLDPSIRTPGELYKDTSVQYYLLAGKLADYLGMPKPVHPKPKRAGK